MQVGTLANCNDYFTLGENFPVWMLLLGAAGERQRSDSLRGSRCSKGMAAAGILLLGAAGERQGDEQSVGVPVFRLCQIHIKVYSNLFSFV